MGFGVEVKEGVGEGGKKVEFDEVAMEGEGCGEVGGGGEVADGVQVGPGVWGYVLGWGH